MSTYAWDIAQLADSIAAINEKLSIVDDALMSLEDRMNHAEYKIRELQQ